MAAKLLVIVIDQFRADCINGALADFVNLPNLKSLMTESVTFNNHFTIATPCGPARASLLTGQYAMNHHSIRNATPLEAHHATIGHALRRAGYDPMLFGYTDTSADPGSRHPNDPDLRTYAGLAPGFSEIVRMRQETPGSWEADLKAKGYVLPKTHADIFRPVPSSPGEPAGICDPAIYAAKDSDSAFLTDQTIRELSVREHLDWFSLVTYIRPHPPLVAPAPFNSMYPPHSVPPPIAGKPLADEIASHPFIQAFFSEPSNHILYRGFDGRMDQLTPEAVQELRSVYLGLASEVDEHIGTVMHYLRQSGQYDDTLIVVTSDHGEMLGDHHMWGKITMFDGALRIPLIIRDPRSPERAGSTVSELTESIDISPTLLDWIGHKSPQAFNGRSLLPLVAGQTPEDWRQYTFSEIDLSDPISPTRYQRRFGLPMSQCNLAIIRDHKFKYVHFNGGLEPMLFDLTADPNEATDLATDPAHKDDIIRLSRAMLNHRMRHANQRTTHMKITGDGLMLVESQR